MDSVTSQSPNASALNVVVFDAVVLGPQQFSFIATRSLLILTPKGQHWLKHTNIVQHTERTSRHSNSSALLCMEFDICNL